MKKYIEALETLLEGQKHTRAYFERMGWGDSVKNMTPGVEALEWALGKLEADPEPVEIDIYTGEIVAKYGRAVKPIGRSGHYGPIRVGAVVQAKVDVSYVGIFAGEVGKLTHFDSWAGEEYPYIADFEGGRSAAFERNDLRRVD